MALQQDGLEKHWPGPQTERKEQGRASREPTWDELHPVDKCERLRVVVRGMTSTIEYLLDRIHRLEATMTEHQHDPYNGAPLVPAHHMGPRPRIQGDAPDPLR